MKIVLSRKGLDSQYGGIPSPVIETEHGKRFFPIPIPREGSNIKYTDLKMFGRRKVSDFLKDVPLRSTQSNACHLDPDIRFGHLSERPKGWFPAFGQSRTALNHLQNCEIGKGDVFLFFGWFQYAELGTDGKFKFKPSTDYPNGFHAIYGYLQVAKKYDLKAGESVPDWLQNHPHVKDESLGLYDGKSNAIFVAEQFFTGSGQNGKKNGSSLFSFTKDLILTQKGQKNRTKWELPAIFHPDERVEVSYNPAKNWKYENGRALVTSAYKGQEFVIKADPARKIEQWCCDLIMSHSIAG